MVSKGFSAVGLKISGLQRPKKELHVVGLQLRAS